MSKAMTLSEIVEDLAAKKDVPLTRPAIPPDSTPIADALLVLRGPLTIDDCAALGGLVGVRTLGDLRTVLERGEIVGELGEKLRKVLG